MKAVLTALAACVVLSLPAGAQTRTPAPATAPGLLVTTGSTAPKGSSPVKIEDVRVLQGGVTDPFELERLGLAAVNANQLDRARALFEQAWTRGELPSAAYNLACLDARTGRADHAFARLDKAIAAGFDDGVSLEKDPDLAPLRGKPRFASVVSGAAKNRAAGDAAVVKEGVFLLPKEKALAVLLLLHDKESDPFTVSGPFTDVALSHHLLVAAPRGPGRSAKRRFGWGSAERAEKAIDAAVAFAFEEAALRRSDLLAVHAWTADASSASYSENVESLDHDDIEQRHHALLSQRLAGWRDRFPDVQVHLYVVCDRSTTALLKFGEGAQLLAVGSRSRGMRGRLLGSTSNALTAHCECPVVVVRPLTYP